MTANEWWKEIREIDDMQMIEFAFNEYIISLLTDDGHVMMNWIA